MRKSVKIYNFSEELIERIDRIAKKNSMSRSELLRETIERVFDEDPTYFESKKAIEIAAETNVLMGELLEFLHQERTDFEDVFIKLLRKTLN